jgi:hypothetical protein
MTVQGDWFLTASMDSALDSACTMYLNSNDVEYRR